MNIKIISVDFQKDFSSKGGVAYRNRPSVKFIKEALVPFLRKKDIKIAEIVSDYRRPRPADRKSCCRPGEWGFESEISEDIKDKRIWFKCMNSPLWIRKNIGIPDKKPGLPYQDTKKFDKWLTQVIGKPDEVDMIVLIGLTLDCCVLCTAQELNFRGYNVRILVEGVDTYSGNQKEKKIILNSPLDNWAEPIKWSELRGLFDG